MRQRPAKDHHQNNSAGHEKKRFATLFSAAATVNWRKDYVHHVTPCINP